MNSNLSLSLSIAIFCLSAVTGCSVFQTKVPTETASIASATDKKADPYTETVDFVAPAENNEAALPEKTQTYHREVGPVPFDQALRWLKNGNGRFLKGSLRKDGQSVADRNRLSTAQHPHSIILSCSDSRVPPELIFDQKLGEIFVVRNAGNNSDTGAIASIEYGIEHLGVNLLVVMGHQSCGAVKAAFNSAQNSKNGSPYLDQLLDEVRVRFNHPGSEATPGYLQEGWENTSAVAANLLQKSEIIRDAVQSGSVKIQTALYHLDGQVEWEPNTVH